MRPCSSHAAAVCFDAQVIECGLFMGGTGKRIYTGNITASEQEALMVLLRFFEIQSSSHE